MAKLAKRVLVCLLAAAMISAGAWLADRQHFRQAPVRVQVVANSDGQRDRQLQLRVLEAVADSIRRDLQQVSDGKLAERYLQEKLDLLQQVAEQVLLDQGSGDSVAVSLYSGISGAGRVLRIVLGGGMGQNCAQQLFPEPVDTPEKRRTDG